MTIVAATDGSALGNPGPAGWAWYIDDQQWAAGGWAHATNNMGELTAVLELLRATAASADEVHVYCDSQYVINTITKWMKGWKAKGWKKKDGKAPENLRIIQDLDAAMTGRKVQFTWVKGHAGHPLNEAADVRAQAAAASYQSGRSADHGPGFAGAQIAAGQERARVAQAGSPVVEDVLFADPLDVEREPVDEVIQLEIALLRDETRTDTGRLAELLHPSWREITITGVVITRDDLLLDGLAPTDETLEVVDTVQPFDDQIQLITRRSNGNTSAVRSSHWVLHRGHWRLLFQQTTPQNTD